MAKKKRKKDVQAEEFMEVADDLLAGLESAAETSKREVAPIRFQLAAAAREAQQRALTGMQTAAIGRTRVLVPTSKNTRRVQQTSQRVRQRMSNFSLKWLDKGEVRRLVSEGFTKADQATFFRHSNRLARNAKQFLERLGEVEPTLQEEINATIRQIDDARNDLLKLEVRSFTNSSETLLRNINGKVTRTRARADVRTFDIDRNLFNLSMLEHPKGVTRELLANASERMAQRVSEKASQLPSRALVFVGAGPDAVSKMTPDSRTARAVWRLFTARELDKRFAKLNTERGTTSNWRQLGLSFNTPEWYVPVPPEIGENVEKELRKRRRAFLENMKKRAEEKR